MLIHRALHHAELGKARFCQTPPTLVRSRARSTLGTKRGYHSLNAGCFDLWCKQRGPNIVSKAMPFWVELLRTCSTLVVAAAQRHMSQPSLVLMSVRAEARKSHSICKPDSRV